MVSPTETPKVCATPDPMASPLLKFLILPLDVSGSTTRLIERMFAGEIPKTSTPVVIALALAMTWPRIKGADR